MTTETKTCAWCHAIKPLTDYYTRKVDGYTSLFAHCKACHKQRTAERKRERRAAGDERILVSARQNSQKYRASHPRKPPTEAQRERRRIQMRERMLNDLDYRERQAACRARWQREQYANKPEYRERIKARRRREYWGLD